MTLALSLRSALALLVFSVLFSAGVVAQPQAVTRVEGNIQDEVSGGPVGCKIYVYGPDGKRIRSISSNSADGSYLMVINEAGKHRFVIGGYNVYSKEYEIDVPTTTSFQEIKRNMTVRMFREGEELYAGVGFEENSALLSAAGRKGLEGVLKAVNDNQQLQIVIDVYPDQDQRAAAYEETMATYFQDSLSWVKDVKAHEKKYRRKKEKPDPPVAPTRPAMPSDPNKDLVQQRVATVMGFFKEARNSEVRVTAEAKKLDAALVQQPKSDEEILKEVTAKKKKSKSSKKSKSAAESTSSSEIESEKTLVVKIGAVKRLFGD